MKEPKQMTVKDYKFMYSVFVEGVDLGEAYRRHTPKSKMSKLNQQKEGYKLKMKILKKMGTWSEVFAQLGLGEERISAMLTGEISANRIMIRGERAVEIPDWNARHRAGQLLAKIHGMVTEHVELTGDITAKDVASNKAYVDMVAETMQAFTKKQEDENRDNPAD